KETLKIQTEKETSIRSKNNLLITTNASMGFETDKNTSMVADNITTYAKTIHELKADSEATIQVGETIIKAGGVEVVIDSNGLVVKGGEIRTE
ncbi:VgrG protein, partial [Campylobacter jejuni]|nr:VgrG protein [Campylobacter jejuni]EKF2455136.1 VgrG protein [Campylobacter jejuni]